MNIKSNKDDKSGWNMNVGEFFSTLTRSNTYWGSFLVWIIFCIFVYFLDGSWGIYTAITIIALIVHYVLVGVAEQSRVGSARWDDDYKNARYDLFSLIGIPLFMVFLSYPIAIKPMIQDYKTAERIDRVLSTDVNTTLFYNDSNKMFILFVDGQKQPLVIDKSGSSETYNRLKADFLDNKIKVIKKETKTWLEDNASIAYTLDSYTFD